MKKTLFLLNSLILFVAAGTWMHGAQDDWAQWRGRNQDGLSTETGLLTEWPPAGPPLLWKAIGLGNGYSTLAIAGNKIFTLGDKGDRNFVIALSRVDGKPVWETDLGKAGAPGWGGFAGPRCMPTIDEGLLLAVGQ